MWFTRPLSPSLLKILALEATYLLPLRLVLLDEMMSDLTTLVDGYLNTYREGSADRLGSMEVGGIFSSCAFRTSTSALFLMWAREYPTFTANFLLADLGINTLEGAIPLT